MLLALFLGVYLFNTVIAVLSIIKQRFSTHVIDNLKIRWVNYSEAQGKYFE
jgi:hypothetical protein